MPGFAVVRRYQLWLEGSSCYTPRCEASLFQKMTRYRGIIAPYLTVSLVHLQMGRAFAMTGDINTARTHYQDFLALWKGADPDIPILQQAKAEYAKLE
jgi:hypothetical protein